MRQWFSWTHLSQHVTVEDFEDLIEAELAESLHGITDEGGGPPFGKTSESIFSHSHCKAVPNALIFIWIHLRRRRSFTVNMSIIRRHACRLVKEVFSL